MTIRAVLRDWSVIDRELRTVPVGNGSVIVVAGPPNTGKTALCNSIAQRARECFLVGGEVRTDDVNDIARRVRAAREFEFDMIGVGASAVLGVARRAIRDRTLLILEASAYPRPLDGGVNMSGGLGLAYAATLIINTAQTDEGFFFQVSKNRFGPADSIPIHNFEVRPPEIALEEWLWRRDLQNQRQPDVPENLFTDLQEAA